MKKYPFFTKQSFIETIYRGDGYGVFNNISVISWRSVLLVGETRVPGPAAPHWQTWSHNVVYTVIKLPIYFNSHMRIYEQITNVIPLSESVYSYCGAYIKHKKSCIASWYNFFPEIIPMTTIYRFWRL